MSIRTSIGPPPLPEGCPQFYGSREQERAEKSMREFPDIAGWIMGDALWDFYDRHRPRDYPTAEECKARILACQLEQERQEEARSTPRYRNMFGGPL